MRRLTALSTVLALLSFTITLPLPLQVHAQSKKKGKEPELAICKRGKLIFEDDFSEDEIQWRSAEERCRWRIAQKTLVSESSNPFITRNVAMTNGLVVQFDILSPKTHAHIFLENTTEPRQLLMLTIKLGEYINVASMDEQKNLTGTLASTPLSPKANGPYTVVFEACGGKLCLSAFGKRVIHDTGITDLAHRGIQLNFRKGDTPFVAIDNVKCWEALPLDAPDYKEEKPAEATEPRTDEAKPAETGQPKEEKPAVELGTTLGTDAAGKPIAWDISAKGTMRSTDDKGALTKVTLYGPGQMSTNIEAETLVLMGKGDVEITVEGASQTVTVPGRAKIEGKPPITLKAKKGTVQITDVKAE